MLFFSFQDKMDAFLKKKQQKKQQPTNQIKMYWWPDVNGFVLGYHHSTWWDQSPNAFIVH